MHVCGEEFSENAPYNSHATNPCEIKTTFFIRGVIFFILKVVHCLNIKWKGSYMVGYWLKCLILNCVGALLGHKFAPIKFQYDSITLLKQVKKSRNAPNKISRCL